MDAPEDRHRVCWYSRRTPQIPDNPGFHTIEDGHLLFCAHPMWFPVVGYQFDIRNCAACDYFKPVPPSRLRASAFALRAMADKSA